MHGPVVPYIVIKRILYNLYASVVLLGKFCTYEIPQDRCRGVLLKTTEEY